MTQTTVRAGVVAPRQKPGLLVPVLLQVLAMVGIGALVYSSAADWFARLHHNSEISGYVQQVEQIPDVDRESKLQVARDYNAHLPTGVLRDPYTTAGFDPSGEDAAYAAYQQVLAVADNGVIGQLSYPRLGINLPIYHGTADKVLRQGVGHLYGSSLPVGGPSTHSVLTSHSGLVHASLFTPLPKAEVGDTFTLQVLGETHWYQVDQLETVLPEQTEGLAIVSGEDHATLITCTPLGINSHRLLVRGVRVEAPDVASGDGVLAGDGKKAGFPWWALVFVGGSAAVGGLLFAPPRRARSGQGGESGSGSTDFGGSSQPLGEEML